MSRPSQVKRTHRRSAVQRGSFSQRRCADNHEAGSDRLTPHKEDPCAFSTNPTHSMPASICTQEPCSPTFSRQESVRGVPGVTERVRLNVKVLRTHCVHQPDMAIRLTEGNSVIRIACARWPGGPTPVVGYVPAAGPCGPTRTPLGRNGVFGGFWGAG